jgi:hypothetical protein
MKFVTAASSGSRRATAALTWALAATDPSTREPAGSRGAALTATRRDDMAGTARATWAAAAGAEAATTPATATAATRNRFRLLAQLRALDAPVAVTWFVTDVLVEAVDMLIPVPSLEKPAPVTGHPRFESVSV